MGVSAASRRFSRGEPTLFCVCQDLTAIPSGVKVLAVAHILFVDDEPALRELTSERLVENGYDVVQADSGERALQLVHDAFGLAAGDGATAAMQSSGRGRH